MIRIWIKKNEELNELVSKFKGVCSEVIENALNKNMDVPEKKEAGAKVSVSIAVGPALLSKPNLAKFNRMAAGYFCLIKI